MNNTTEYRVQVNRGDNTWVYHSGPDDTAEKARDRIFAYKSREILEARIVKREIIESVVDFFTVPAYVPTLDEIAQDIIDGSNGSFYMEWGDDIEQLSDSDRSKVEDIVWQEISNCDSCGWHFHHEDMENVDGENLCWKCAEDAMDNDEEDEDED